MHDPELATKLAFFIASVCILCNITEMVCYLLLFHHIYQHDNTVAILILNSDVIKIRNSRNAISLMGQLCTWLLETSYFLLLMFFIYFGVATNQGNREKASIIKLSEFTLLPLVQILGSPPLRKFTLRQ